MSKYTTELRYICETLANKTESCGYDDVNDIISTALPLLFNFDFPIFDENYRTVLETKIIKHFYRREICAETVGLWKLYLDTKLNEIMPYYNQLYRSELIEFNPLYDVDLTRNHTKTGAETGSGSNTGSNSYTMNRDIDNETTTDRNIADNTDETSNLRQTGTTNRSGTVETDEDITRSGTNQNRRDIDEDSKNAFSDTPNNQLDYVNNLQYLSDYRHIVNDNSVVDNGTTTGHDVTDRNVTEDTTDTVNLTNANTGSTDRSVEEDSTVNQTGNVDEIGSSNNQNAYSNSLNSTETYIETVVGTSGGMTFSKRIAEFRKNFLNIDMQVINELNSLFFGLW